MDLSKWKLTPKLEAIAQEFLYQAKLKGYDIKITQGYRTAKYQDDLYAQGRTKPGPVVTDATSKQSWHCKGKAFDIAFKGKTLEEMYNHPEAQWKALADLGKELGLIPGFYFKKPDMPHFEIH